MRRRAAVRNSDRLTDHSERASSKVIVALFGHDEARPGSPQESRPNVGFHRTDTKSCAPKAPRLGPFFQGRS
jgi:hypothetical protein